MRLDNLFLARHIGRKPIIQAPDKHVDSQTTFLCQQKSWAQRPAHLQVMFVLRKAKGDHSDKFRIWRSYDDNVNAHVQMPGENWQGQQTKQVLMCGGQEPSCAGWTTEAAH